MATFAAPHTEVRELFRKENGSGRSDGWRCRPVTAAAGRSAGYGLELGARPSCRPNTWGLGLRVRIPGGTLEPLWPGSTAGAGGGRAWGKPGVCRLESQLLVIAMFAAMTTFTIGIVGAVTTLAIIIRYQAVVILYQALTTCQAPGQVLYKSYFI